MFPVLLLTWRYVGVDTTALAKQYTFEQHASRSWDTPRTL